MAHTASLNMVQINTPLDLQCSSYMTVPKICSCTIIRIQLIYLRKSILHFFSWHRTHTCLLHFQTGLIFGSFSLSSQSFIAWIEDLSIRNSVIGSNIRTGFALLPYLLTSSFVEHCIIVWKDDYREMTKNKSEVYFNDSTIVSIKKISRKWIELLIDFWWSLIDKNVGGNLKMA